MELYILDDLLRRETLIDRFESLIWTERFNDDGDFQLSVISNTAGRAFFKEGKKLAMNKSLRVMQIESVVDGISAEGEATLEIEGPSLEQLLDHRVARPVSTSIETDPTWDLAGPPAVVARKIFDDIVRLGLLTPLDKIPFLKPGAYMPASGIPEIPDPILISIEPKSVRAALQELCKQWVMGYRLLRPDDSSSLYFDIYTGTDRTTGQTIYPSVVFSPGLDNLQNIKSVRTIEGTKNVALVISKTGSLMVYPPDAATDIDGFDRRVLVVVANDIDSNNPDPIAAMTQLGRSELSKYRAFAAFDGEINPNSQYVYGRDYNLGDLVELQSGDGQANKMRVVEQIFAQDREGERSYPTLALNTFVNTGSWLSYAAMKQWVDYENDPITWSQLP